MDKKRQSILKPEGRIPLQEMVLPDFPDEDTATVTVTKSRRVSFGANFVKEFIVGSAVSAQFFSEYEQAVSSSDSSNPNTSRSGLLDLSSVHEGGGALNLCVKHNDDDDDDFIPVKKKLCCENQPNIYSENIDRNNDSNWDINIGNDSNTLTEKRNFGAKTDTMKNCQKPNKKVSHINDSLIGKQFQRENKKIESDMNNSKASECSEKKNKQGKFSSTICFSADSPSSDMQFTEGCISLAKSILDKKNREMKVYIQAKPKENHKGENRDCNGTVLFEASDVEMSLTKCVANASDDDSYLGTAAGDISSFLNDSNEESEYTPLHMNMLNAALDQDSDSVEGTELKRSLFSPKKSLTEMLSCASPRKSTFSDNDMSLEKDDNQECDMELVTCASLKIETSNSSLEEKDKADRFDDSEECPMELDTCESSKLSCNGSAVEDGRNMDNQIDMSIDPLTESVHFTLVEEKEPEEDVLKPILSEGTGENIKDIKDDCEPSNTTPLQMSICNESVINEDDSEKDFKKDSSGIEYTAESAEAASITMEYQKDMSVVESAIEFVQPPLIQEEEPKTESSESSLTAVGDIKNTSNDQECNTEPTGCTSLQMSICNDSVIDDHGKCGEKDTSITGLITESLQPILTNKKNDSSVVERTAESVESQGETSVETQEKAELDGIESLNYEDKEYVKDVGHEECDVDSENCSPKIFMCNNSPEVLSEENAMSDPSPVFTQNEEALRQSFFHPEKSLTEILNECDDKNVSLEKDINGDCEAESIDFEISVGEYNNNNNNINNSASSSCRLSAVSSTEAEKAREESEGTREMELSDYESLKVECRESKVDGIVEQNDEDFSPASSQSFVEDQTTAQDISLPDQSYTEGMNVQMECETSSPSDESLTSVSLWDRKIVLMLTEQSKEPNCHWRIEDLSCGEDAKNWVFSFPLLSSSAVTTFSLRPPGKHSEASFSLISEKTISLRPSTEYQSEKILKSTEFAFTNLRNYFADECVGLDNAHKMPLFLDRINLYLAKLNGVVVQILRILREYPGSRLRESTLSFRLYSFPLMFSCSVMIDVSDPLRFSENSVSSEKHFGNFSAMLIKSVFKDCLKSDEVLIQFVRTLVQSVIMKESECGSVTNRSFIRLIA